MIGDVRDLLVFVNYCASGFYDVFASNIIEEVCEKLESDPIEMFASVTVRHEQDTGCAVGFEIELKDEAMDDLVA